MKIKNFYSPIKQTVNYFKKNYTKKRYEELNSYQELLKSSDSEKVIKIAKKYLPNFSPDPIPNRRIHHHDLSQLVQRIEKETKIPIQQVGKFKQSIEYHHFKDNFTFINLPYTEKLQAWPDRAALQDLIRKKFHLMFKDNDKVIIPGAADGQIPIEIYINSRKHGINLDIVASDLNATALKLGYLTMKSFGLNADKIDWVQADSTDKPFIQWVYNQSKTNHNHQVVTLIQPSLAEEKFLFFLKYFAKKSQVEKKLIKVVMPILLENPNSRWHKRCDKEVQDAFKISKKYKVPPALIWNKTQYGVEMLRKLNTKNPIYLSQQYFIKLENLEKMRKDLGYSDKSEKLFDINLIKTPLGKRNPRIIEANSQRILCIWKAKK